MNYQPDYRAGAQPPAHDKKAPPTPAQPSPAQAKDARRKALGAKGEKIAAQYFRDQGIDIVAANVRYTVGEIDLIVREPDETYVFVEVKTRRGTGFGLAESVTPRKLARLRKAAVQWLRDKPMLRVRFDVITIIIRGATIQLEHHKDVM